MSEQERREADRARAAAAARDAALRSLVANAVSLALTVGLMIAISKRDELGRLRMLLARRAATPAQRARRAQDAAVAAFQRELHDVMRGGPGPAVTDDRGLYG